MLGYKVLVVPGNLKLVEDFICNGIPVLVNISGTHSYFPVVNFNDISGKISYYDFDILPGMGEKQLTNDEIKDITTIDKNSDAAQIDVQHKRRDVSRLVHCYYNYKHFSRYWEYFGSSDILVVLPDKESDKCLSLVGSQVRDCLHGKNFDMSYLFDDEGRGSVDIPLKRSGPSTKSRTLLSMGSFYSAFDPVRALKLYFEAYRLFPDKCSTRCLALSIFINQKELVKAISPADNPGIPKTKEEFLDIISRHPESNELVKKLFDDLNAGTLDDASLYFLAGALDENDPSERLKLETVLSQKIINNPDEKYYLKKNHQAIYRGWKIQIRASTHEKSSWSSRNQALPRTGRWNSISLCSRALCAAESGDWKTAREELSAVSPNSLDDKTDYYYVKGGILLEDGRPGGRFECSNSP